MRRFALLLASCFAFALSLGAIPAPVAHFGFELSNGVVADSVSGKGISIPTAVSVKSDGIAGSCLALKRQEDSVLSLGKSFGFTGDFSISFWMRTSPSYRDPGAIVLARHLAGSYNGYFFMVNSEWGYGAPNKLTFYYSNATVISKSVINDGRWHHVGLAYRKNQGVYLFIDGSLDAQGPVNLIVVPDAPFVVGSITYDKPRGSYTGDIDELALFDRALDGVDFTALAENPGYFKTSTKGFYGNETLPPSGGPSTGSQSGGVPGGVPGSLPGGVGSGAVMRIILKSGQVISLPSSDIARIEFTP